MKTSISDLQKKGYVAFPYPMDLRSAVDETAKLWKKFCALPLETKLSLPYSNNTAGVGYELKEGVGNKADKKENFDVTLAGIEWLETHIKSLGNHEALEFVEKAIGLLAPLKPIIYAFAQEVEREFGLAGFTDEVSASENSFFIRFIHCFGGREVGEVITAGHPDQSGFTPHLFESSPGLQCLNYDGVWEPMPVSRGETVIIPDMQMQLRSDGKLRALWHRVVATTETAEIGRYSAVCFIQLKNTPKYNKEQWGRLQEMEEGFNYNMKPEEFAKFFKM
ncbi:MAG: 2OG-Fe(II) oxygenase family protein [Patescibacteria group bacterium]